MNNQELAVVFDMDGVLLDTVLLHWQAYNTLLQELYGVQVADEQLSKLIGMSLPEQIPALNNMFSIDIRAEEFIEEANKRNVYAKSHAKIWCSCSPARFIQA